MKKIVAASSYMYVGIPVGIPVWNFSKIQTNITLKLCPKHTIWEGNSQNALNVQTAPGPGSGKTVGKGSGSPDEASFPGWKAVWQE